MTTASKCVHDPSHTVYRIRPSGQRYHYCKACSSEYMRAYRWRPNAKLRDAFKKSPPAEVWPDLARRAWA